MTSLKDEFLLEIDEDITRLLGLQIDWKSKTGEVTISYTGLLECILEAMETNDSNPS